VQAGSGLVVANIFKSLLTSTNSLGDARSVSSNSLVVLEDCLAALSDGLRVSQCAGSVGLRGRDNSVQGLVVGAHTSSDLGNLFGVCGSKLCVTLGSGVGRSSIQQGGIVRCITRYTDNVTKCSHIVMIGVGSQLTNPASVLLLDVLVQLHNSAVNRDCLRVQSSQILSDRQNFAIQSASVVQEGKLGGIDGCLAVVGLDLVRSRQTLSQCDAIAEQGIGVLVSELTVAKESRVVVLVDQSSVLSNQASGQVGSGLVMVHTSIELKDPVRHTKQQ
jgi:hypothetical protein